MCVCVCVCVRACVTHTKNEQTEIMCSFVWVSVRPTDIHKKYINDRLSDERVNGNKSNKNTIKQDTKKYGHTSDERDPE